MKLSEALLLLLIAATLAGLGTILLVRESRVPASGDQPVEEQSTEPLVACFELIALGGAPRARSIGDTLVYTIDLDTQHYTPVQANLLLTRALDETGIGHLATVDRGSGVLSFLLSDGSGVPLRIDVKH